MRRPNPLPRRRRGRGGARKKERDPLGEVFEATVRKLRESRRWTQEQLAEAFEMSPTFLGFLEHCENVPTLPVIVRLAVALKVTPATILDDVWKKR